MSKELEYAVVADGQSAGDKTREGIVANTSAVLMQNGAARFDPDNSRSSFVLWKGMVASGLVTCPFNQDVALKVGYRIVVCVNTPAGKDAEGSTNYAYVNAQAIEVVDENDQGFRPYTDPDITIDEENLEPGATILLVQLGETPTALDHYEVTFTEPLRAGWWVCAVVYWRQNSSIFLTKGNDYEDMFHRPDDSALVSGTPEEDLPVVSIAGQPEVDDTKVTVTLGGVISAGAMILLKRYQADTTEFTTQTGTFVASHGAEGTGNQVLEVSGEKLVAFLLNSGNLLAQSDAVAIGAVKPASLFTITCTDPSITSLGAFLCPVTSYGVDSDVVRLVLIYDKDNDSFFYFGTEVKTIQAAPEKEKPVVQFVTKKVTAGMTNVKASLTFDSSASGADYTIYQFSDSYSDQEFEDRELWENLPLTQRVGQINSNYGDVTRGEVLTIPIRDSTGLKVGARLRQILKNLNIPAEDMTYALSERNRGRSGGAGR